MLEFIAVAIIVVTSIIIAMDLKEALRLTGRRREVRYTR